jgi:hypothetical protein
MSNNSFSFKGGGLYGLIATILLFIAVYYIAKGVFWVLYWVSPLMLIATVVLDYQVVINYLKMLWGMILRSPITGILASIISFFAFPIVILFLLGRAWFGYYIRKKQREQNAFFQQFHETQQREEEFVPYEEVIDNRLDDSTNQTTFEPNKEKKRNHL